MSGSSEFEQHVCIFPGCDRFVWRRLARGRRRGRAVCLERWSFAESTQSRSLGRLG